MDPILSRWYANWLLRRWGSGYLGTMRNTKAKARHSLYQLSGHTSVHRRAPIAPAPLLHSSSPLTATPPGEKTPHCLLVGHTTPTATDRALRITEGPLRVTGCQNEGENAQETELSAPLRLQRRVTRTDPYANFGRGVPIFPIGHFGRSGTNNATDLALPQCRRFHQFSSRNQSNSACHVEKTASSP
jgi:hypothetical protein